MAADDQEARAFAKAFRGFLAWLHADDPGADSNPVVSMVRSHLGEDGLQHSVVTRELAPFEHVNLQLALDAWASQEGRTVDVQGVTLPPHYGSVNLQQLLHGDGLPPVRLSAPDLVDLPSGPDVTQACLTRALLLVTDQRGAYILMVRGPDRHHDPTLSLELAGLATQEAQAVLRELAALRSSLNIYRGHLLEVAGDPAGASIQFIHLPETTRADVILPEAVLRRLERHTTGIASNREALRSAGQHLKRGLLLFGPPGTGKTHTTRYLVQQLSGSTVLMLSGRSLHMIAMSTQLARELQPAVVVLEDVDLVAEDRGYGPGSSPLLFELLDAMDGAAADADLLFLLTTNRADLLEPALAARPGRVDVAVEIGLPDGEARRRLFELYARELPLQVTAADVDDAVERTAGVTASFMKELLRRAVLEALEEAGSPLHAVTGTHLSRALIDLLDSTQSVTRALLGVPTDSPEGTQPPSTGRDRGGHRGMGWMATPSPVPHQLDSGGAHLSFDDRPPE